MIGKITGRLEYIHSDHILIDVGGVGYLVYCSDRVLTRLPKPGAAVALYTDLLVREDNLQLFGFLSLAEKEWHKLLITVQGVGAKAALAIQSTLGTDGVQRAITLGDATAIKAAPGVGPKLAQRIVTELKDKAPNMMALGASAKVEASADPDAVIEPLTPDPIPDMPSGSADADALSALVNLGYAQSDAAEAIARADQPDADASTLIKAALKLLAPQGR
ncbi:MAG: Holliday junction branch migration protein RuvA [Pseudomonadota bacterium]